MSNPTKLPSNTARTQIRLALSEWHSIISGLESCSGVLEWSGVKFGGDFGVEFFFFWGGGGSWSGIWSVFFFSGGFLESMGCSTE